MRKVFVRIIMITFSVLMLSQSIQADAVREKPFDERIRAVLWEGERYEMTFEGIQKVAETRVGTIDQWVKGLAFHPDGRIAFSDGRGTTPIMVMAFWNPEGMGDSVVNLQYAKRNEQNGENKTEEKGYFWFFAGPLAFDPNGISYFSLGSCGPNGLYKVVSNSPVEIEKLYSLGPTRSLQVPVFDKEHLYSTSSNGIYRYPIRSGQEIPDKPWFSVQGEKIMLGNCLVLNRDQVLADVVFRISKGTSDKDYYIKSFLFDRTSQSCKVLSVDEMGPMAVSLDGQRMIRFDKTEQSIKEFSFVSQ